VCGGFGVNDADRDVASSDTPEPRAHSFDLRAGQAPKRIVLNFQGFFDAR
jgi:hypothetical protein